MNKAPTTFKPGATQTVAVADSSAASSAVNAQTRDIRVVSTVDAYVEISSAPTASSSSFILPAFTVEYLRVAGADKVAFLRIGSTTGTARVTELSQ
ncbi:hypothetical protein [uncultured Mediterranean phage uvMED]|jgi:hypothetical protein|nr:hypothetical protein [uncultured Mediterranean phage uvMED]BAR17864.1 hypothetical protein [uncultured Mediterranean phage uvMED]|tara:strand:+ start:200 stop:487 length:288 start_codon:yes stop_codon:yes gene_type:complete